MKVIQPPPQAGATAIDIMLTARAFDARSQLECMPDRGRDHALAPIVDNAIGKQPRKSDWDGCRSMAYQIDGQRR